MNNEKIKIKEMNENFLNLGDSLNLNYFCDYFANNDENEKTSY
jgi:hypothetical protein